MGSAFHGFPDFPGQNEVAFCKINEIYCCASSTYGDISTFTTTTKDHPKINVARDVHHQHRFTDENISMYVDVDDNLLKRISSVWFTQGFKEALNVAADRNLNRDSPMLALIAGYTLKIVNSLSSWRNILQSPEENIGPIIIAKYSRTRNWSVVPIKRISWHPHTTKIAVVTSDDNVRVYSSDNPIISTLKCKIQENVSSVSWRPYSVCEIAVGCEQGVIVWTVDPNSTFTKPSATNTIVLKRANHTPVTDVSWSPHGDILISCSEVDSSILVWEVSLQTAVAMTRITGGTTFIAPSPDATKVFAATSSIVFRVWNTNEVWESERWCTRGGRVAAACWGPNNVLLFAAKGESMLYALSNSGLLNEAQSSKVLPVLDTSRVDLDIGESVGGAILDLVWDPTGRYLAILFEDSPHVAIFCTALILLQIKISPCCFVTALNNEMAVTMDFQKNFAEGACLTIVWSSGRVQHFPVIYTQ